jgi:Tfp pilus assembly protein PilF
MASQATFTSANGCEEPDETLIAAAKACADRGDYETAASILSRVMMRGTAMHQAFVVKAILHEGAGEDDLAVDFYQRALLLEPRDIELHARLGLLQARMGHLSQATEALRNAIALGHRSASEATERWVARSADRLARLLTPKRS